MTRSSPSYLRNKSQFKVPVQSKSQFRVHLSENIPALHSLPSRSITGKMVSLRYIIVLLAIIVLCAGSFGPAMAQTGGLKENTAPAKTVKSVYAAAPTWYGSAPLDDLMSDSGRRRRGEKLIRFRRVSPAALQFSWGQLRRIQLLVSLPYVKAIQQVLIRYLNSCGRRIIVPITRTKRTTVKRTVTVTGFPIKKNARSIADESPAVEESIERSTAPIRHALERRNECPACPAGSGVVNPFGKTNNNQGVKVFCCPARKTVYRTVRRTSTVTTTVLPKATPSLNPANKIVHPDCRYLPVPYVLRTPTDTQQTLFNIELIPCMAETKCMHSASSIFARLLRKRLLQTMPCSFEQHRSGCRSLSAIWAMSPLRLPTASKTRTINYPSWTADWSTTSSSLLKSVRSMVTVAIQMILATRSDTPITSSAEILGLRKGRICLTLALCASTTPISVAWNVMARFSR
jgi:hypothetical protein